MTKIRDLLKERVCDKCKNSDPENFVLYFVLENGSTTNYISCLNCGDISEVKIRKPKAKDYMLEPNFGMGG